MNDKEIKDYIASLIVQCYAKDAARNLQLREPVRQYISQQFASYLQSAQYASECLAKSTYTVLVLPTHSLNALIHQVPNTNHFLFVFDTHLPTYLHSIAKISSYTLPSQEYMKSEVMQGNNEIGKKKIAELFARPAALLLDLFFTFLRTEGKIGRELHPFGGSIVDDIRASAIRDHMYQFIIGHEIGHIVNGDLENSPAQTSIEIENATFNVISDGWKKEFKADEYSLHQILKTIDINKSENIRGSYSALVAAWSLLLSFSLYERFSNYVYTGEFKEGVPSSKTHPPSIARIEKLGQTIDRELRAYVWVDFPIYPGFSPSIEIQMQADGLRSAWLLNETILLNGPPDLQRLKKIWIEVKALNERNNDAYYLPEGSTISELYFDESQRLQTISSRNFESLKADVLQHAQKVDELTSVTSIVKQASIYQALGNALSRLGMQTTQTEILEEALAIYDVMLAMLDRDAYPEEWARAQFNIGVAQQEIGRRGEGTFQLLEAEIAYRLALFVRTRESNIETFVKTQTNLGITLLMLGQRESSVARLQDAITIFDELTDEFTKINLFNQAELAITRRCEAIRLLQEIDNS